MNTTPPAPARTHRRRNRLLIAVAALLSLLLGGYFLLTSSWVMGRLVLSRLGSALGGKATAAGVRFLSDGSLVLDELRLRVPGVDGDAAEIFSAARISAHVQLGSLAFGGELVDSIVIDRPRIRVSQGLEDGALNLAGLSASAAAPSVPSGSPGQKLASAPRIPQITINEGAIEIGEHSAARGYVVLKRLDIEGKVESQPDVKGGYQVYLRQVPTPGQPRSTNVLDIRGHIAADTLTLEAQGLKLADFPPQALPTPIRAQYTKLDIAGEIGTTTLTYLLRTGGLEVRTGLAGVALNLPVTPKPGVDKDERVIPVPEALKDRQMRMEQVKGELVLTDRGLSGNVSGLIEDFPYEVTFSVDGTHENAPFSATLVSRDFELKERSDLAIFAPGVVQRRLEQFSNPTGIVNIEMQITRAAPVNGVAQEVKVGGTLLLRNGSAAFERFPYRFYNMSMEAVFTDTSLELRNIRGDTPEGAKVVASAKVSPLTDDAGVTVDVKVTGLPVNSTLAAAMKHRGKIIDVLFNQEQYRRLLDAGLVINPVTHALLTARRDELRALPSLDAAQQLELSATNDKLKTPVFEPGGTGEVQVHVTRIEGPESIWNDTVDIDFDRVGVLPEAFAYPMIGTDVKIRKVDYDATVGGGSYVGLSGATARIAAKVDLQKLDDPDAPFVPMVEVDASAVPVDPLMLFALPDASALSPDGRPLRELIRDLHLDGAADVRARIWQLEGDDAARYGNTAYDIEVDANKFDASPARSGQEPRLSLWDLRGSVDIRHSSLEMDLAGIAAGIGPAPAVPFPLQVKASMEYAPAKPDGSRTASKLSLDARAQRFDAPTRVEDLVWLFAPEAAIAMTDARQEFNPAGAADLLATLRRDAGGPLHIDVRAWKPLDLWFTLAGTRMKVECGLCSENAPVLAFTPGAAGAPGIMSFPGMPYNVYGETGVAATVAISGKIRTDRSPVPDDNEGLSIDVHAGRLGTPPISGFLAQSAPKGLCDFLSASKASGAFDATITAHPDGQGRWVTSGTIQPHTLELVLAGTRVSFHSVEGQIDFSDRNGSMRGVHLQAPTWSAFTSGSWQRSDDGQTQVQNTIDVDAGSLSPDLLACLPEDLRTLISDLSVRIDGPVRTSGLDVSVVFLESGNVGGFASSGRLTATNMSMDAGLKVSQANAILDYSARRGAAGEPVAFDAWAFSDSLKASDVAVTNAKFRASSGTGATQGSVLIPHFSGNCHGGRVSGDAVLSPPAEPGGRRPFTARAQGSNIRFASVIADFQAARRSEGSNVPPVEADATPDGSRGMVDFGVTLTGITSTPESRRGRGTASVGGGRVASMPLVVPLIRISNLQLPVDERLDYAQADFFVQGNTIEFEQAWISSPGVELVGYGSMKWPEATVDVRVRGSSRTRIPIVSKVMDSIRNELFTARVTGPVWDPKIGLESFNDTGRMIGKIIGATPSEATERLRRIEQNAVSSPRRPREGQPDQLNPEAQPR